ncbi:Oxidoreductase NAD-binding domain-containing protein 1 [Camelus dromedarius]|uniref:Oxidoreductase NAD-binding domain-containing protein 1 n=1 Tax=Camelus dromedarius TaxID=9838 RepID=A0A5N4EKJ6_CAMDR|nr:Oxidoreductase NAD-binding domain-containing protein 1 [Camelus dromedarius]
MTGTSGQATAALDHPRSLIRPFCLYFAQRVVSAAKVCDTADESPSVKRLRLLVADKGFSFKAGQWCFSLLPQCALGSEVAVRVGGEFFFDPQPADASRNLVLIAGGVGINPLLSILRHSADLHRERADKGSGYEMGTVTLFYSAKNTSELLFKKNILDLVNEFPEKMACSLHVTKQTAQISAELKPYITEGRITEKELSDHISKETLFYICGPPPMTDFFSKELEDRHVPPEHICFEKWW